VRKEIKRILKPRKLNTSKRDYGHVLIIAGSPGLTGAATMTAQAAMRSGAGLVTVACPESSNAILATKLTCAMTLPLPETKAGTLARRAFDKINEFSKRATALCIGPGLGRNTETQELARRVITSINLPMIIDADGLNALSGEAGILKRRKETIVISPHSGEMARLIKKPKEYIEKNRIRVVKDLSKRIGQIVILKGHESLVAKPGGKVYKNTTGNPGMATGGSGDVLSGMIASFLAQGINSYDAACIAVYLHGQAGDLARDEVGEISLTACDILRKIPEVILKI